MSVPICPGLDLLWSFTDFTNSTGSVGLEKYTLGGLDQNYDLVSIDGKSITLITYDRQDSSYRKEEILCPLNRIDDYALYDSDGDDEIFTTDVAGTIRMVDFEGAVVQRYVGETGIVQPAALRVADVNRDGLADFVTGPRNGFSSRGVLSVFTEYP